MGKMDKLKKNMSTSYSTSMNIKEQMNIVLNKDLPEDKNKVVQVELSKIKTNPHNDYREIDTAEGIYSLAEDIERNGLLHNLVVSKRNEDEYILLSGERRFRALSYLHSKEINSGGDVAKYRSVSCRVVEGLSERQEMIMLDAANLQTRGGVGTEAFARKAMTRYMANVKMEYNLSDRDARRLLQEVTSLSNASITNNIQVEENLIPRLLEMLDNNEITKRNAIAFAKLTEEHQNAISKALFTLKSTFAAFPGKYPILKEQALNGFMTAAEEPTNKRIEIKIADVFGNIKSEIYKHNSEIETAGSKLNVEDKIRQAKEDRLKEKTESQRDTYLKKCNKLLRGIEELSTPKTVERIKKFDLSAEEEHKKVILKIEEIIESAQKLKEQIVGDC